ncbi:MAG: isochorismatase family cysteine hydrolase [Dehalococcoidia bacterium]
MGNTPSWQRDIESLPKLAPRFEMDARRTALLIIDMQNLFGHPDHGFAAYLRERYPEAFAYYMQRISSLVMPNHLRLLDFFRKNGLRVIYVTVGPVLPDMTDMVPLTSGESAADRERARKYSRWMAPAGTFEHRILEDIKPLPGEMVINKTSYGAFNSTGIDQTLRNMKIDFLVITGVATHACVETTARDAADRGYRCVLVDDATATFTQGLHDATLRSFATLFGRVANTEEVCTELRQKVVAVAGP